MLTVLLSKRFHETMCGKTNMLSCRILRKWQTPVFCIFSIISFRALTTGQQLLSVTRQTLCKFLFLSNAKGQTCDSNRLKDKLCPLFSFKIWVMSINIRQYLGQKTHQWTEL